MKRVEHRDENGALLGVELTHRDTSDVRCALEVQSAPPGLLRICLGGHPLLWARVWDDRFAWSWLPARRIHDRGWPPVHAASARAGARSGDRWAAFWIDTWWDELERATARTRGRVDVVPLRTDTSSSYGYLQLPLRWSTARVRDSYPQSWDSVVLPTRAWPSPDDARVKAYRKLARAGELPPIVLRWVSGVMASVVIDGHARLVAAELKHVEPRALAIVPVHLSNAARRPAWTERATATLDALLLSDDARTGRAALATLNRTALDRDRGWIAIERARPIPGGASRWRSEVERELAASGSRDADLTVPFERPGRFGFA